MVQHFLWLWTGTLAFVHVFWRVALLVTVILGAVRLFSERPRFEQGWSFVARRLPWLGFAPESAVPLLTGFSVGIAYGAGLIIGTHNQRPLHRAEVLKIAFFLSTCHAIFEDTLIFTLLGANPWVLVSVRLLLALLVVRFIGLADSHRAASQRANTDA